MNFRSSKKTPFAVPMAVVLIISIFMSLFLFSTDVKAAVYGPKYFYLSIERQNLKKALNDLKQTYVAQNLSEYSYSGSIDAELKGEFFQSDESLKKLADFLTKLDLSFNYNMNSKDTNDIFYTSSLSTKYDGKELGGIDAKYADEKAIITLPGLTDKAIGIDAGSSDVVSSISKLFNKALLEDDEEAFQELFGLSRDAYNHLFTKYIKDVIFKQIPNEKVTYLKAVKYKQITCNAITFNIDEEIIADIYLALADELRNDEEFKTLYKSIANIFNNVSTEMYGLDMPTDEDYEYEIQQMCDELEYQAEMLDEIQIAYTAYFTPGGDILFRQINDRVSDTKVALDSYTDVSGSDILNLRVESFGQELFGFNNEKKLVDGNYKGKFNFYVTDKTVADVAYTYENEAKVGGLDAFVGELKGNIYLEQFNVPDQTQMSNIDFTLTSQRKGVDTLLGEVKVSTSIDKQKLEALLKTEIKQSDKANISKPDISLKGTIDINDMESISNIGIDVLESLYEKIPEIMPEPDFGSISDLNEF